jgi:hypothetical protein
MNYDKQFLEESKPDHQGSLYAYSRSASHLTELVQ